MSLSNPIFQHYIFDPRESHLDNWEVAEKTYDLWFKVWSETFGDLIHLEKLHSDDFLRYREISTVFCQDEPIGIVFYNWIHLGFRPHLEHSYFDYYPEGVLGSLKKEGHKDVMIMSYLTISPQWRKTVSGVPISDVMIGLAVKRFESSSSTALISFTRNNRKVNELVYRFGAKPFLKDCVQHNVKVDFIKITKESILQNPIPGVQSLVNQLWEQTNNKEIKQSGLEIAG